MRITAVTCVKNEGPFLLEWIAYNRLIGVSDFLFYSNDCTDGTDALLDALAARGILHHLPNPAKGRAYQMEALKHSTHQPCVRDAEWVWIADVDEFLNIHVGDHSLPALIEACGNPQAISVHFQFFANGGVVTYEDRPIIEQFTHSHNPDIWCEETAIEVKSLIRQDFPPAHYGAHRPLIRKHVAKEATPKWTDGSGCDVPNAFLQATTSGRQRKFPAKGARAHATLNHYALRSLDSYLVKNDRGDVNRGYRNFDDSYWRERNDPSYEDRSIQRMLPALKTALEDLKSDPEIAALHEHCVARHRARCQALLAQPRYQEMHRALQSASTIPPREEALLMRLDGLAPSPDTQPGASAETKAMKLQASARRVSERMMAAGAPQPTQTVQTVQTVQTAKATAAPKPASNLKVVNLGLPKSGTTTLNYALSQAGFEVADHRIKSREDPNDPSDRVFVGQMMYEGLYRHGDPVAFLSGFDALSEISFLHGGQSIWPQFDLAMLLQLRKLYPELRFVATRRDTKKHVQSIMRWNNLGTQRIPSAVIPSLPVGYGGNEAEQEIWIDGHYDTLAHWFRDDPLYLELDVSAPDAKETLHGFLGVDLPWWGTANANPEQKSDQDSDGAALSHADDTGAI